MAESKPSKPSSKGSRKMPVGILVAIIGLGGVIVTSATVLVGVWLTAYFNDRSAITKIEVDRATKSALATAAAFSTLTSTSTTSTSSPTIGVPPTEMPTRTPTPTFTKTAPSSVQQPSNPSGESIWGFIDGLPRYINTFLQDPNDPQIIYAASGQFDAGDVYQSNDGGITWRTIDQDLPNKPVSALAFGPGSPPVLFAFFDNGEELYSSSNDGQSWKRVSLVSGLSCSGCSHRMYIHPDNGRNLFIADGYGVTHSWDGGQNWAAIEDNRGKIEAASMALDPSDPNVVYVGVKSNGIYQSSDAGQTWTPANKGMEDYTITAIAVDPKDPQRIYAGSDRGNLFISTNKAQTWVEFDQTQRRSFSQAKILDLAINPTVPSTIYLFNETDGFLISTNAGQKWTLLGKPPVENHPSFGANLVNFNPQPRILLNIKGAGEWRYAPDNPPPAEETPVAKRPSTPPIGRWSAIPGLTGDIRAIARNPTAHQTIFIGTSGESSREGNLLKSSDGGLNWQHIAQELPLEGIETLAFGPGNPIALLASLSYGNVYMTTDSGERWTKIGHNDHFACSGCRRQMFIEPSKGQFLLITEDGSPLSYSLNGGQAWMKSTDTRGDIRASSAAFDPRNKDVAYAGTKGSGVYKTVDGGSTWLPANTGMLDYHITALTVNPENTNFLYAGGYDGEIFRSIDGGKIWNNLSNRLPDTLNSTNAIKSIAINPDLPDTICILVDHVGILLSKDGGDNWSLLGKPPVEGYPFFGTMAVQFTPKLTIILTTENPDSGVWRFEEN